MKFAGVFPYGRSFEEYSLMFSLTRDDRNRRILGIGDGPSSFNSEATAAGWNVVSIDPIYELPVHSIQSRCETAMDRMIDAVAASPEHWIWHLFKNKGELREHRRKTLQTFLAHFGSSEPRRQYIGGALPQLPFRSNSFDLALCSHVVFSWADLLGLEFHFAAIREMLRVAREVRIFPIRQLNLRIANHVDAVIENLRTQNYCVETKLMKRVPQIPGTEQLIIRAGGMEPV